MTDLDTIITAELERMLPVTAEPDWDAVAHAAGLQRKRRRLWPRSRRQSLAVVFAALILAGGAVAAVREAPWWQSGSAPVDPAAVASVARDNMPANVDTADARTVVQDGNAALVAVPLKRTGYCLIPALNGRGSLGAQCEYQVVNPTTGDDDRTVSLAHPSTANSPAAWLVYGRITDPRAAKLDLGPFSVTLSTGGFFLNEIPSEQWPSLNGTANRGRILDSSGNALRTGCVNWGASPTSKDAGAGDVALFESDPGRCTPQPAPTQPTLDLSQATKLVQFTLEHDFSIWRAGTAVALWQAPVQTGTLSVCVWVGAANPAPTGTSHGVPSGPGECGNSSSPPRDAKTHPFDRLSVSVGGAGLIIGHVNPASGIDKVALASSSGSVVLPLQNGWFIGQLPEGARPGELPPGGPFDLIGSAANGTVVAHSSLEELVKQASPH